MISVIKVVDSLSQEYITMSSEGEIVCYLDPRSWQS